MKKKQAEKPMQEKNKKETLEAGKEKTAMPKEGKKSELEEMKETLQRLQAEFENSRKRMDRERQEFSKIANALLIKELLPLLDSMDSAEKSPGENESIPKEKVIEGIELLKNQLLATLKSQDLEEIKSLGEKFDPMLHDCIMQEKDAKKEEDTVLEELQKGYMLNGRVLRHAKVKVNKQ